MTILVTKKGTCSVLHLFPETYEEQHIFEEFYDRTRPCTVKFCEDAAYTYPHIEISKEIL